MSTPSLKLTRLDGSEIEFEVRTITRQRRKAIKKTSGLDLFREFFKMMNQGDMDFSGDLVDAILEGLYPDMIKELDDLSMVALMSLVTAILENTFGKSEETKKNLNEPLSGTTSTGEQSIQGEPSANPAQS